MSSKHIHFYQFIEYFLHIFIGISIWFSSPWCLLLLIRKDGSTTSFIWNFSDSTRRWSGIATSLKPDNWLKPPKGDALNLFTEIILRNYTKCLLITYPVLTFSLTITNGIIHNKNQKQAHYESNLQNHLLVAMTVKVQLNWMKSVTKCSTHYTSPLWISSLWVLPWKQ